jgi:N-acetylglucosaminyl-diphospho-decaprenol L-rhamnosyltransferase
VTSSRPGRPILRWPEPMAEASTPSGNEFDVGVICVTHNSTALLGDFAAGVRQAVGELRAAVCFVDSGSSAEAVEALGVFCASRFPEAHRVDLDGNRGFSAGINTGLRRIRALGGADAYAIVNPDVVLGAGCLPPLVAAVREPHVGIAAPQLHDEHGALLPSLRNPPRILASWCEAILGGPKAARLGLPAEVIREPGEYSASRIAGWATGGMLVISDRCVRAVGDWDESFFMYDEEVDFALRAADAGYALRYVPAASATRTIGPGPVAPWAQALMLANRVELVRHRSGRGAALATRLAFLVGEGGRAILGRPSSRAAVWALLRRRRPAAIMAKYRPDARAVITGYRLQETERHG